MGQTDLPFAIPAIRCENGKALAHARIGWWRSVHNVPRAFAEQVFVAELAEELGRDHRELLLELIGPAGQVDQAAMGIEGGPWNYGEAPEVYPLDTGRLAQVLTLASDAAGWGAELPPGEGIGLAVHRSFVTYVAAAARVKVLGDGTVTVPAIDVAVDCGFPVNPERIRSQMEGAAVMGMTLALHSAITFADGAVEQSNFSDYAMVRSDNFPTVTTHVVAHPFSVPAAGVGEPGVPPIAPAILNGIFRATGKRLAALPVGPTV